MALSDLSWPPGAWFAMGEDVGCGDQGFHVGPPNAPMGVPVYECVCMRVVLGRPHLDVVFFFFF